MKGAKGKAKGKRGGKRAPKRAAGKRRGKKSNNVTDWAAASVKISLSDAQGQPFVVNRMYDVHNVNLANFDRAVQIAQAYQFFRIKRIALTYKIGYDTYQAGAGAATRPNFYYILDKSQSIPNTINLNGLKQMGARPRACDEKPITVAWAPSVLSEQQTIVGQAPAAYRISPFLNTNQNNLGAFAPSLVEHNGLYWFVQMDATAGVVYQYTVEMEVQFEFKKPLWTASTSTTVSRGVKPALTNDSPDGLVGGADEEPNPIFPAAPVSHSL